MGDLWELVLGKYRKPRKELPQATHPEGNENHPCNTNTNTSPVPNSIDAHDPKLYSHLQAKAQTMDMFPFEQDVRGGSPRSPGRVPVNGDFSSSSEDALAALDGTVPSALGSDRKRKRNTPHPHRQHEEEQDDDAVKDTAEEQNQSRVKRALTSLYNATVQVIGPSLGILPAAPAPAQVRDALVPAATVPNFPSPQAVQYAVPPFSLQSKPPASTHAHAQASVQATAGPAIVQVCEQLPCVPGSPGRPSLDGAVPSGRLSISESSGIENEPLFDWCSESSSAGPAGPALPQEAAGSTLALKCSATGAVRSYELHDLRSVLTWDDPGLWKQLVAGCSKSLYECDTATSERQVHQCLQNHADGIIEACNQLLLIYEGEAAHVNHKGE